MLQTQTYLVAIGILLIALFLRPAPVVIVQRDRGETSTAALFIVFVLIVISVVWLLSRTGCSFPTPPSGDKPVQNVNMHINKQPLKSTSGSTEDKGEQRENNSRWILRIKIFDGLAEARSFVSPIPGTKIRICQTEKGNFWTYVTVDNEVEGLKMLRYWEYFEDLGLDLKVMNIDAHKR